MKKKLLLVFSVIFFASHKSLAQVENYKYRLGRNWKKTTEVVKKSSMIKTISNDSLTVSNHNWVEEGKFETHDNFDAIYNEEQMLVDVVLYRDDERVGKVVVTKSNAKKRLTENAFNKDRVEEKIIAPIAYDEKLKLWRYKYVRQLNN